MGQRFGAVFNRRIQIELIGLTATGAEVAPCLPGVSNCERGGGLDRAAAVTLSVPGGPLKVNQT